MHSHCVSILSQSIASNEEQIISGCPIDGATSFECIAVVCLHSNAIVSRCILDTNNALWDTRTASAPSILLVLLEPHCIVCSAIVNDRLIALGLAITPDMGHDGWATDVTLSNIHERSLFTLLFHLYENTKVSIETP